MRRGHDQIGPHVPGLLPALDRRLHQLPRRDELGEHRPRDRDLHPEVVGQIAQGRDAERFGGVGEQLRLGLRLGRCGRVEDGRRKDPLGDVVQPLEGRSARRDMNLPGDEQPLQSALLVRPIPHLLFWTARRRLPGVRARGRHLARRQRALAAHPLEQSGDELRTFPGETGGATPDAFVVTRPSLPPAQQRLVLDRHQRRFVRPRLEEMALAARRPGELVEPRPVVGPEAAEQRQVVAAHENADRIDLQQVQAIDDGSQVAGRWAHVVAGGRSPAPPRRSAGPARATALPVIARVDRARRH